MTVQEYDEDGYKYTYDYENRIVKIEKPNDAGSLDDIAMFEYDALGMRIARYDAVAGETVYYYYNNNWQVLAEYDDSSLLRYFVYGNYIDEPLVMSDAGGDYYYAHDHLYSVVSLSNSLGQVVERYEYDAYGKAAVLTATCQPLSATQYGNPYYFTGRRLDVLDDGNLLHMYYRHRTYDAYMARFLQHDPFGINPAGGRSNRFRALRQYDDGLNLYVIVNNNPVNALDPMGLWSDDYPNPWKDPKDRICDKYSGLKKKLCEKFYDAVMCSQSAKVNACKMAGTACQADCGTQGEWLNSSYFQLCINYCNVKMAQCVANAKK